MKKEWVDEGSTQLHLRDMSALLLVDGSCVLCDGVARAVFALDSKAKIEFSTLQGETASELRGAGTIPDTMDSVILVRQWRTDQAQAFVKSDAVIELGKMLEFPWNLFVLGKFLPLAVRNALYDLVARNRLKWFGKKAKCGLPEETFKERTLP